MPYTELYCHFVWATRGRAPLLIGELVGLTEGVIRTTAREQGAVVHAVGVMPDHVHVAISSPARLAIADLAKVMKGSSSHMLNRLPVTTGAVSFAWQAEYGALPFSKRSLSGVAKYVLNQRAHHAEDSLWPTFEIVERPYTRKEPGNDG